MFDLPAEWPRWAPPPATLDALCLALAAALKRPIQSQDFADLSRDESGAGSFAPHVAVFPESTAEVAAVMRIASQFSAPVTPRGAGSGKSGGALPVHGGILLAMTEMRRLVQIARADHFAIVEPGVLLGDFQRAVLAEERCFPPDPASADFCTVGGAVAENAAGPRAFKYGTTKDYVLGMTAVLASGEVLALGRKTQKGVAGYDLTALLCGSEGTLAVITELTLGLVPRPLGVETALLCFKDVRAAASAVVRIVDAAIHPATLELLDAAALDSVRADVAGMIDPTARACLIVELEGDASLAAIERAAAVARPDACLVAADDAQRRRIWDVRKRVSIALKQAYAHKVSEDIVVPPSAIPHMIDAVQAIAAKEGLAAATYGHAGDGNLHTNYLWNSETDHARVDRALAATYRAAVAFHGTITGEHGVGLVKREYLGLEQAPPLIALQRRVKATFDPQGILNPGKMFPSERNAVIAAQAGGQHA